jgi:hypothetical protein
MLHKDQSPNEFRANQRGEGYRFGREALREPCYRNELKLVMESYKSHEGEEKEESPGQLINV